MPPKCPQSALKNTPKNHPKFHPKSALPTPHSKFPSFPHFSTLSPTSKNCIANPRAKPTAFLCHSSRDKFHSAVTYPITFPRIIPYLFNLINLLRPKMPHLPAPFPRSPSKSLRPSIQNTPPGVLYTSPQTPPPHTRGYFKLRQDRP